MSKYQTPKVQKVERQNIEWDTMSNDKISNGKKCRKDKLSNGTQRRMDIMSKVRKAEWDIMSNGTQRRMEMSKVRKADWDKISNDTKNVESKQCRIRRHAVVSKRVENVESKEIYLKCCYFLKKTIRHYYGL
jgi:hypothetical protein